MTADAVGGVWTFALDLARGLAPHGVATTLAVMGPAPGASQLAEARQVPGLRLVPVDGPLDWLAESPASLRAAARAVAALAAGHDAVQLNTPALAALAGFPVPAVVVSHSCLATWWRAMRGGPLPPDFAWRAALHGEGLSAASVAVAPTRAHALATAEVYGGKVVPGCVWNGRHPAGLRAAPQLDAVFTAGRLWDEGKDVATLDRAAARLRFPVMAAGPVAGPNGARAALSHARPLGPLPAGEVAAWLARRPVFASAARYEPFGLAVLEAAQAGCALVLADIPDLPGALGGRGRVRVPRRRRGLRPGARPHGRRPRAARPLRRLARARSRRYGVARMAAGMHALLREGRRVAA
jgi:glycosyltransferase involved in cell wall biosynthesis